MKQVFILLCMCVVQVYGDSMETLDQLITVTRENYEVQVQLREIYLNYQALHEQYYQNTEDHEMLVQLVFAADQLLDRIKEAHLDHIFDAETMKELSLFSRYAKEARVPAP